MTVMDSFLLAQEEWIISDSFSAGVTPTFWGVIDSDSDGIIMISRFMSMVFLGEGVTTVRIGAQCIMKIGLHLTLSPMAW